MFCGCDKSYFSTSELMHHENVNRKMMKIKNKQVVCKGKCEGCNSTSVEVRCICVVPVREDCTNCVICVCTSDVKLL
jgi:hypothetical protein